MNLLSKKFNLTIPYAICISLIEQEQRRKQTIKECNKIGLPVKFFLTELHPQGGVEGCKDSHKKVIQYAKNNNLEYILVIEDDIVFDMNSIQNMKPIHIPKFFDMFYLGYHINRGHRVGDQILQIQSGLTTHAYIMKNTVYDIFLNYIDQEWNISEFQDLNEFEKPFFTQTIKAVDMFYAKFIHHQRNKTYGVYPMIAYQRPEFSSIENAYVDYRQLFITKANYFAQSIKSQLRCQYIQKDQQKVIEFLKNCHLANDYDYIHVQPEVRLNPYDNDNDIDIQNKNWDILYITDDEYLIRKQAIYYNKHSWRIRYLYPSECSLSIEKINQWLVVKPTICFYGPEHQLLNEIPNYLFFYCSEQYKTIQKINNKIFIPKHQYALLPTHQVLLKNDITFFIDQPVIKPNVILWMTKDTLDYQWKCDWCPPELGQGEYTIPWEGKALLTNMSRYINLILFDTKEICDKFCDKYEIVYNPKNMIILSNGNRKHNFEIQDTNPIPWNIITQTNKTNFMKIIQIFKTIKKQFPQMTMTIYGCSKNNKKKMRNISSKEGIKIIKGDIDLQSGDILLLSDDNENLYWKAKMGSCFIISREKYMYMNENDILLDKMPTKLNREELKRKSFADALREHYNKHCVIDILHNYWNNSIFHRR